MSGKAYRSFVFSTVALISVAFCLLVAISPARAQSVSSEQSTGYPKPEAVGFHHAALVYADDQLDERAVLPLFNRVDNTGKLIPRASMFDAAVLLRFTINGKQTDYGATTLSDWQTLINQWFSTGGPIDTFEKAAEQADLAAQNAGAPQQSRRSIIVMMPWMNPSVNSFGQVNGSDRDLSSAQDRQAVAQWFANTVSQRFSQKRYAHLALWGLYRMREDVPPYEQHIIASDAQGVHNSGLKYLFIPYYKGLGWQSWKEYGFDVAIMQPSYAFRSPLDGGEVNASRLQETAVAAQKYDLGVELEFRGCSRLATEQVMAMQYLASGSTYGYQDGVSAAFLGEGFDSCGITTSSNPSQRSVYDALADYVSGKRIPSPDVDIKAVEAKQSAGQSDNQRMYVAREVDLKKFNSIRIDFAEHQQYWQGEVQLQVETANGGWKQLAWATRPRGDSLADDIQGVVVSFDNTRVNSGKQTIRLILTTAQRSPVSKPPIVRIVGDPSLDPVTQNGLANAYTVVESGKPKPASYPDKTSHMLHDGEISTAGWSSGRNVGWNSNPGKAVINIDLGSVHRVGAVKAYTQGGSDAAVNWPLNPVATFSNTPTLMGSGTGTSPLLASWPFSAPHVIAKHAPVGGESSPTVPGISCLTATEITCTNQDGYIEAAGTPVEARYINIGFSTNSWAMLSELQVVDSAGNPIDFSYRLARAPGDLDNYSDDGLRLTDGRYTDDFAWKEISGWPANEAVALRFDAAEPIDVNTISVYTLNAGSYGIVAPTRFTAQVKIADQWVDVQGRRGQTSFGSGGVRLDIADLRYHQVTAVRILLPGDGAGWAWTMISEVKVE